MLFRKFIFIATSSANVPALTPEQIANSYITSISAALKEYQPGLPQQVYQDLAWGGLDETPAYNALSIEERNRIIAVCNAENKNEPQTANGINYNPISNPCY